MLSQANPTNNKKDIDFVVSIQGSCFKLLRVTCSSCLFHFFLYLFWWGSCPGLALASFSITISTFFYRACMFNSQRVCAQVGSTRDGKELTEEWRCTGRNLLPLMTCLEMRNSLRIWSPLGKNLLLPSWFIEDFKKEPSAFLLGIFVWDSQGKNLLLPYWGFALDAWHIEEESSTSLLRMMFGSFDSL